MAGGRRLWRRIGAFPASGVGLAIVGLVVGVVASVLVRWGNPPNMGICTACFERDIAGAIGLHRFAAAQYLRPEIPGFVLGAFVAALLFGEFRPRGGSAPMVRLLLGGLATIGSLVFLGCTWRALLRLGGGDGSALAGVAGTVVGVAVGALFLRRGYTLGAPRPMPPVAGLIAPGLAVMLLAMLLTGVSFMPGGAVFSSVVGPGSMRAPVAVSLAAGLLIGLLGQRSRFCTVGATRDVVLVSDFRLLGGVGAMVAGALIAKLATGQFGLGMAAMPIAHSDHLWSFLSMVMAGLAFCLAGGCPGRQLVLCGEGNTDSAVFVMGTIGGGAVAHNWALAGVPDKLVGGVLHVGGPALWGKVAVIAGLAFCLLLGTAGRAGKEAET